MSASYTVRTWSGQSGEGRFPQGLTTAGILVVALGVSALPLASQARIAARRVAPASAG